MSKVEESKPVVLHTPFVNWLIINRRTLLIVTSTLVIALFFYAVLMNKKKAQSYHDFQTAEQLAEKLEAPSQSTKELVEQLRSINDQYPSLQNRYAGIIAQELLLANQNPDPYAATSIKRLTSLNLSAFADFSEISLLTSKQLFPEALAKATSLLEKLSQNSPSFPSLKAFTLLQMASLQKSLGKTEESKKTLQHLQEFLKTGDFGAPILALLHKQNESLLDYLLQ